MRDGFMRDDLRAGVERTMQIERVGDEIIKVCGQHRIAQRPNFSCDRICAKVA